MKTKRTGLERPTFEYSDGYAQLQVDRGRTRSDRCPECRKRHRQEIRAFPVAYVDIEAIGEAVVVDPELGPSGPLGGLGPLPSKHEVRNEQVQLTKFGLGLQDADILELLQLMQTNHVVILEAGTGTGKSTLAPFRLMNPPEGAAYRPNDFGPIIVTEPRVPATTEVARFVGESMCYGHDPETCREHVGPGYPVGYQAKGEKVWDEACQLVYVTDGSMINWIIDGRLATIGTVIVDEAHERSENIDAILTLLAAHLPRYPHLRVVIASATIDKAYFMGFFSMNPLLRVKHFFVEAPKAIGYGIPLFSDVPFDDSVLESGLTVSGVAGQKLFQLGGWPGDKRRELGDKSLRQVTKDLMLDLRRPARDWPKSIEEASVTQAAAILQGTDEGDVLVFLPNQRMVETARDRMSAILAEADWGDGIRVDWLMSKTPAHEKELALAECDPGKRKVVFASNLAETSLTIAGIRYVVDSGLVNQATWDPALAVSDVPLVHHSQSGIRQRWGRVGRKTHGWVFPLYSLAQFREFPRDTPAGSTQTNLENYVLKLLAAGVDDLSTVPFPANFEVEGVERDRFATESARKFGLEMERAVRSLTSSGAVAAGGRYLTGLGQELARSRVPAEQAIAMMYADRLACVPEVATVLTVLTSGGVVGNGALLAFDSDWPDEWKVHARRCHEGLSEGCLDELDLVVRIFALSEAADDKARWCRQWWVDPEALQLAETEAGKLIDSLAPGMSKLARRPLDPALATRARSAIARGLAVHRYVPSGEGQWQLASSPVPEPVTVSEFGLTPPPHTFVALSRSRPRPRPRAAVNQLPTVSGLVAVEDWASRDDPTPFELMIRVREAVAAGIHQQATDPFAALRRLFPVGCAVQVPPGPHGLADAELQRLSDGLAMPEEIRDRTGDVDGLRPPSRLMDRIVYTSESRKDESQGELRKGARVAGAEPAEEETRLVPLDVRSLEQDIEDFTDTKLAEAPANTRTSETPWEVALAATWAHLQLPQRREFNALVAGYHLDPQGRPVLLLEPTAYEQTGSEPELGTSLTLRACEVVRTHDSWCRVLRSCTADGELDLQDVQHFSGPGLDELGGMDGRSLIEGSRWTARVVAGSRKYEARRISLLDQMMSEMRERAGEGRGLTSLEARLTGDTVFGYNEARHVLIQIELDSLSFVPRLALYEPKLERQGIDNRAGDPIKVGVDYDKFRAAGRWRPEDVETIVEGGAGLFAPGKKPSQLELRAPGPLNDAGLEQLLAVDPGAEGYQRNAWLLWQSSRRIAVLRVEGLADAVVEGVDAANLRRVPGMNDLGRRHNIGVQIRGSGRLRLTGSREGIAAALDELQASLATRQDGQLRIESMSSARTESPPAASAHDDVAVVSDDDGGADDETGTSAIEIAAPIKVRDVRDGCFVTSDSSGLFTITDKQGRSVQVPAADYRRDSRPLHWLRQVRT